VPSPRSLSVRRVPPASSARSRIATRPRCPARGVSAETSKPTPLSVTRRTKPSRCSSTATTISVASECLRAFVRDAMPGGGRIEIEIDEVDVGPDHSLELEPGRFALLAVSDTGVGIDAQTVGQIFEPFFTTKSEGTGLGLATVYGIVRQSGGTIWVYSEPGSGTVFKIYLPLAAEAIASAAVEPPARVPDGAGEHVLVIEDDRQVRSIVKQMLVRRGYSVVTADGPAAALAAAAADARFDAILSDLVMPNGGGRELVAQLVASQPDAAVVFMSGYSDDAVRTRGVVDPGTAFIEKPFSSDDLVLLLRQTISGRREAA